jgi:hypothetical protein
MKNSSARFTTPKNMINKNNDVGTKGRWQRNDVA